MYSINIFYKIKTIIKHIPELIFFRFYHSINTIYVLCLLTWLHFRGHQLSTSNKIALFHQLLSVSSYFFFFSTRQLRLVASLALVLFSCFCLPVLRPDARFGDTLKTTTVIAPDADNNVVYAPPALIDILNKFLDVRRIFYNLTHCFCKLVYLVISLQFIKKDRFFVIVIIY